MYVTISVEARSVEEAKQLASEDLHIKELGSSSGNGTTLTIDGDRNSIFVDSDNCYDQNEEVNIDLD